MGRKKFTAAIEQFKPDPRYHSNLAGKFVNYLMWDGKKAIALKVFYDAMDLIAQKIKDVPPNEVFEQAIENIKPDLEVRSKRVGGQTYQVPMPVRAKRRQSLAIRWVLQATRSKSGRPMSQRLAEEFMAAYRREGTAMTTRDNVHRMAEANKAFAHFAW